MDSAPMGHDSPLPELVDSHAHLGISPLSQDPEGVVDRAARAGVTTIITLGIDYDSARIALDMARHFESVFASVGIHPHKAKSAGDHNLSRMEDLAAHPEVVAYGEIGLDFFRDWAPRDLQIEAFRAQLSLGKKLEKPVVIHLRDAYEEGLDMLEQAGPFPSSGVIHCFSGTEEDASRALEMGFYISIPGTVTYKKNQALRKIVESLPEDRLLLETDCPFLPPEPLRGRDNEPAFMVHTAKKVAQVRGITLEEIARTTRENTDRLFRLSGVK